MELDHCQIHSGPEYREHGHKILSWHYCLAQLFDFWLYQVEEDAARGDELKQAMAETRDCLFAFIVRNSAGYAAVPWGGMPVMQEDKDFIRIGAKVCHVTDGTFKTIVHGTIRNYTYDRADIIADGAVYGVDMGVPFDRIFESEDEAKAFLENLRSE